MHVSNDTSNDKSTIPTEALNKYDALALLYMRNQGLETYTPEELVAKYVEAHDRIVKEFEHQKQQRKRRLNPLPM